MHEYDYLLSHHTTIFYISSKQEQSATKFTLPAISAAPPQMSNQQPCLTSIYSRSVVAVVPPAGAAWLAAAAPVPPAPWVSMPLQHVRPVPQPCPLNHGPPRPQVEQSWPATRGLCPYRMGGLCRAHGRSCQGHRYPDVPCATAAHRDRTHQQASSTPDLGFWEDTGIGGDSR